MSARMDITVDVNPIGEFTAIDRNTYDCDCDQDGFFSTTPVGYGRTEAEAIADLIEQMEEATLTPEKQLAKAYADAINTPPNGWGQHVHPVTGMRSDSIMFRLQNMVGEDECQRLIKQAIRP